MKSSDAHSRKNPNVADPIREAAILHWNETRWKLSPVTFPYLLSTAVILLVCVSPGTSYTAFLVGPRPSSPTSGSPRKLPCTVTTPATPATRTEVTKTSAGRWGMSVCRPSRRPSNQQNGSCVSVWACLKTIPIENKPASPDPASTNKGRNTSLDMQICKDVWDRPSPGRLQPIPAVFGCESMSTLTSAGLPFIPPLQTVFIRHWMMMAKNNLHCAPNILKLHYCFLKRTNKQRKNNHFAKPVLMQVKRHCWL